MSMARSLHVDHYPNHEQEVSIYDKLGGGHISLDTEEAEYVRERLEEILDGE